MDNAAQPKFFFDFSDDDRKFVDNEGIALEDLDDVRRRARLTLRDAVADAMRSRDQGQLTVSVRDADHRQVLRGEMSWRVSSVA